MERTELKNAQVLQDFLANQDLKAIYKNIEPKNKSATNLLDQFIGTACQDEPSFEKSTKHWLGQQAALEAVNRSEIDSFISGLDKYLEENIPLLSKYSYQLTSRMKYVSIDIASCFDKMSGLLFQLNQMMDTVLKNQQKLNKQINLNDRYKIDDMILKLKEGINGWGTWCLTNKKLVDDNFVNYLHFRKHELMGLKEVGFPAQPQLVILRSHVVDQHRTQAEQLGAQKTKLFESRKIENWGTPTSQFKQPLEAVLKDYTLASEYILPKEVARVKRLRQITDSLEKGVYFEYVLFNKRDQKRIVKNFGNFSRKMRKNTQAEDTIWNIFEKAVVDDSDPSKVVLKKVESNDPGLDNEQRTDDAPIQRLKEKFEDFEVLPDAPHHQAAHLEPDKDGLPLTGSPFLTPQELAAQQANQPEPFVYVEDDKLV